MPEQLLRKQVAVVADATLLGQLIYDRPKVCARN